VIGPEVESEASAAFSSRRSALSTGQTFARAATARAGDTASAREFAAGRYIVGTSTGVGVSVGASRGEERTADDVARAELAAAPWWLWWNILSMDAPMVAVAWALVFAKSAGVALPAAEVATLGLAVWLIYTVDRLLDGRTVSTAVTKDKSGAFGSPLRQRHFFHRVFARAIAIVAAGVAALTVAIVLTRIGGEVLKLALPVGMILVLYMAWVHLGRGRILSRLPKEVAVGAIFAAGVALPVWSRLGARRWEFFLLAALFAAVCALNCVAIEEWERVRDSRVSAAEFGSGSGRFAVGLAVCAALMTPLVRLRGEFSAIGAAIAVSALLILILDLLRERISADGLRVLVDVALLVPALVILAIR
jgi:hypothetical protein